MTELYQTQRAMRNMRRAAMQRGVIGILDIGTSKIACLVLKFDGSGVFQTRQPGDRLRDFVLVETDGIELARQGIGPGVQGKVEIVFEEVDEDVDHRER